MSIYQRLKQIAAKPYLLSCTAMGVAILTGALGRAADLLPEDATHTMPERPIVIVDYHDGDLDLRIKVRGSFRDSKRQLLDFKMNYAPGIRSKARGSRPGLILGGSPIELITDQVLLENGPARALAPGEFGLLLKKPAGDLTHITFQEFGRVRFAFSDSTRSKLRDRVQSAFVWEDMDNAKITKLNVRPIADHPTVKLTAGRTYGFSVNLEWSEPKDGAIQLTSFKAQIPKKKGKPGFFSAAPEMVEITNIGEVKRVSAGQLRVDMMAYGRVSPLDIFIDEAGAMRVRWEDATASMVSVERTGPSSFILPSVLEAPPIPAVAEAVRFPKVNLALARLFERGRSALTSALQADKNGNLEAATFDTLEARAKAAFPTGARNGEEWFATRNVLWKLKTEFTPEEKLQFLAALSEDSATPSLLGKCSVFFSRILK